MFAKHKFTLLSLLIICAMFAIVQAYYDPSTNLTKQFMNEKAVQQGKGEVNIGGPFTMTTTDGQPFSEQNLLGHYSLIYFGYTFCPDVCPTGLSTIEEAYSALQPYQRDMLDVIMVTVDPARDTNESLAEYMGAFHDDFIGVRGTDKQTRDMANTYLVYYAKVGEGEDYAMDHSAYTYLMGPDGKYIHHFRHKDPATDYIDILDNLLQK